MHPVHDIITKTEDSQLQAALWRMGPSLSRVAAETAGAFLAAEAVPTSELTAVPRVPELGALRSSQKNIGEKHEMICNLSVDKTEWDRLFSPAESDEIKLDAFREMTNCICGGLLAEPHFTDEFGYLIPCVPYAGHCKAATGARSQRGVFRVGGALIHFSVSVSAAAAMMSAAQMAA